MVRKIIILGGGSAGFMAALALKTRLPMLDVRVIRSKEIGVIGVGEGSTIALVRFLHRYLNIGQKKFYETARPTWKLGLKFLWGSRPSFHYTFGPGPETRVEGLPKNLGYYCDQDLEYADPISALMTHDRVFERLPGGIPKFHDAFSYHFENDKYVRVLEEYAVAQGIKTIDDTVLEVHQDERGITGLRLSSGPEESADLYVDASGFASVLLCKSLGEPFVGFKESLFCDRAVVAGWDRTDEPIKPYTTCQTMNAGWCWQIEHEERINRGYVYSSPFISDEDAGREFRKICPKAGPARIIRFTSGCYRRAWVKNVVAVGNASGFVEPLEATALGVIAMQSRLLADSLGDCHLEPGPTFADRYNDFHLRTWQSIRGFIAIHYKFNTRLSTPFWEHCRNETELGIAQPVVDYYRDNGPSAMWYPTLLDAFDPFGPAGYIALLLGQQVPYRHTNQPVERELAAIEARRRRNKETALGAMSIKESLDIIHSPKWRWANPSVSKDGALDLRF
jgi:tryptophan halogenase